MKINPKYSAKPRGGDVEKLHITMQKSPDLYLLVCMYLCGTLLCEEVSPVLHMVMQAPQQTGGW